MPRLRIKPLQIFLALLRNHRLFIVLSRHSFHRLNRIPQNHRNKLHLTAAQSSPAAISFLKIARFPKAVVEKEAEGYSVEINDLKDRATEEKNRSIFASINLDNAANVVSSGLQWQKSAGPP